MKHLVLVVAALGALAAPVLAQNVIAAQGAQFEARLDQELNTKKLHDGDTFTLTEHEGFFHKAPPALKGAKLDGHVENVSPAKLGHGATMNVFIDDIVLADGRKLPISAAVTSTKQFESHKHLLRDTGLVIGGAVAGHMAAKKAGLKHGGLAGAAGGFVLATNLKTDIDVKRGTIVHLKLTSPLSDTSS